MLPEMQFSRQPVIQVPEIQSQEWGEGLSSSELVLFAMSMAVREANSASLEPSVANRIFVGKMLTYSSPCSSLCPGQEVVCNSIGPKMMARGGIWRITRRTCAYL
jgi:hypothetical protein